MEVLDAERRSVFVTVVAWIFIVISGFAVFISIGQNVMIWTHPGFSVPATTSGSGAGFEGFLDENFRALFLGFLGLTIVMLSSSIGLLRRKNWARMSIVALLALWVLWNVATLAMIYLFGMQDGQLAAGHPHNVFIQLFMLVFLVAISVLLIWIIRKLLSPRIVEEFTN